MQIIYLILSLDITFLVMVEAVCTHNCSNNGICKDNQCSCNQNYIGPDCSVNAFILQKEVLLTINQSGTYIVYHKFTDTNPTSEKIYFKYDNPQSCKVQVQISKKDEELENQYLKSLEVSLTKSVSLDLTPALQNIQNVIIILISSKYESDLTIFYGDLQTDSTDTFITDTSTATSSTDTSNEIPILTIVLSIVLPIFVLTVCMIISCNFRKIQNWYHQRYAPQPRIQPQQHQQANQEIPIMNPNQPLRHPQPIILNPRDECSICLENLLNGAEMVITPCQHKFHRNCLNEVLRRQQCCPNCRAALQPKDVVGLAMPKQIQLQIS